ncbi:hypothetical protein [Abyssalbus ytuae]|uniref:Uncharacterized protein n=1 Tax=Abyssalbus ytuae TaxID=2926907 RepID=A0A9E7A0B0_9FLAO|nr:hypothetical protein [Abyssalbus ytuae]UOB17301.1 hypothetical protein MQE35_16390 [Abyssalbus ytuae]
MTKYYSSFVIYKSIFISTILTFNLSFSQELKIITLNDFNLKGKVKHCIVSADYGNEEFYFNEDGTLSQSITRFNEQDFTVITYARSNENELIQKNIEVYSSGERDKAVSLAHFYELRLSDKGKSIKEKIVNFKNEFIDSYTYFYDKQDRMVKVVRNNEKGISETDIVYETNKDNINVKEIHLAGADTVKVIKRLEPKIEHVQGEYEELTTIYANNKPNMAEIRFIDSLGNARFEEKLKAGIKNPYRYYSQAKKTYQYNEKGDVIEEKEFKKKVLLKKLVYEYVYEDEDSLKPVNWIRKTEKYSKSTVSREIEYYEIN